MAEAASTPQRRDGRRPAGGTPQRRDAGRPGQQTPQRRAQTPQERRSGSRRQRGQGGPGQQTQQARLSTELMTLKGRAAKLFHLGRLLARCPAAEHQGEPAEVEAAKAFVEARPEGIELIYESKPLFSADELVAFVSGPDQTMAEELAKTKAEDLDWKDHRGLMAWVLGRGLVRVVRTLQSMQTAVTKLEVRLGSRRGAPAGGGPAPSPMTAASNRQQQGASNRAGGGYTTPQRGSKGPAGGGSAKQGGAQEMRTPAADSSQAFAWSSFQNSPDPKSLPIPAFARRSAPRTPGGSLQGGGNKLGVPSPPPPPAFLQDAARAALCAGRSGGKNNDSSNNNNNNNSNKKTKAGSTPPAQMTGQRDARAAADAAKRSEETTSAIAPSPIRPSRAWGIANSAGGGSGRRDSNNDSGDNGRNSNKDNSSSRSSGLPAFPPAPPAAESVNSAATNALRQMLGVQSGS